MKKELEQAIAVVVNDVCSVEVDVEVTRPEEQFGDYASNVALQLGKQLGQNPRDIAESLATALRESLGEQVAEIAVAGPGFLNLTLRDKALIEALRYQPDKNLTGKTVVTEYSDPNPFKVLHAGHLYTSLIGDSIANLLERAGARVHRVNFGGDVGLHVGKTMWAILDELDGEHPEKLRQIAEDEKLSWMSERYVTGTAAYDDDETAKTEIIALNKRVYDIYANDDHASPFAQIYWTCRQWSYDGFKAFYARLGMTPFEKYYPESGVAELGLSTVKEHIGTVYENSDGAVIFRGEPYGLFTQVFINSQGLPTYAAKDVGLIQHKFNDYQYDMSYIITDVSQKDHLAVVLKSIEQFEPELAARTVHRTHGRIKLAGGVKMSSRKGNILPATAILDSAREATIAAHGKADEAVVLGAVRYAFLKNRIGGDMVYDPVESVSLEGNSGPYLQYAHARARSILSKSGDNPSDNSLLTDLEAGERSLARKLTEYPEVINKAVDELLPHNIATYLYELAQTFNRFYEHHRVIGDERQPQRLVLVKAYADTLKDGLDLLGIAAPERM